MGTFTDAANRLAPSSFDPSEEPVSQIGQGVRQGLRSSGAALSNLAGGVAQGTGLPDFAKSAFATADSLNAENALPQNGLRVPSYKDVHSMNDFFDYGAGQLGAALPVAGTALAAGFLTRGRPLPAMAAGTAVSAPLEMGDVVGRQREAGQEVNLRDAGLAGLGSAALQNIVPGLARAKFAGKTGADLVERGLGKTLASNAMAIPEQAALGAAGEGIKQVAGVHQALDPEALKEAAVGGAVVGAPFAALGAAGDLGHGSVRKTFAGFGNAKDAVMGVAEGAPEGLKSAAGGVGDAIKGVIGFGRGKTDDALDRVSNGQELGNLKDLAASTPEKIKSAFQLHDSERLSKVKQWAGDLAEDAGLSPERRQALDAASSDLTDRANQATVATLKKAQAAGWKAAADVQGLYAGLKGRLDEARGLKKSEDFSGIRQAISEDVMPVLEQRQPELLSNPDAINKLADSLRMFVEKAAAGHEISDEVSGHLSNVFGEDTGRVLAGIYAKIGNTADAAKTERYFSALNSIAENENKGRGLRTVVERSLNENLRDTALAKDIPALIKGVKAYASGDTTRGMTPAQKSNHDTLVRMEMQRIFGDKAQDVLAAIEKEQVKGRQVLEAGDPNLTEGEDLASQYEKPRYYGDKLMDSAGAHRVKYSNEGQAERLLKKAQTENPDRNVRFVDAKDLPADHPARQGVADKDLAGKGLVVAEGMKQEGRFTPEDLQAVRLDTSETSHLKSPSRIDTPVEGVTLDARRLTKLMQGRLPYDVTDDLSATHRTGRVFMEGIAAAQDHLGKSFEVPDSTVIDGKGTTFADVKKLKFTPKDGAGNLADETPASRLDRWNRKLTDIVKQADEAKGDEKAMAKLRQEFRETSAKIEDALTTDRVGRELERRGITDADTSAETGLDVTTAAASGKDMARKRTVSDAPGQDTARQALGSAINRLENSDMALQRKLGGRARVLFDNYGKLSEMDQGVLVSIVKEKEVSDMASTINGLARKYKGEIAPKAAEPAAKPAAAKLEGPPDPKALAAKKAAFLEKAASGDQALIKELKSSTDAKGLQRAAEALVKAAPDSEALGVINARLVDLVQDPDVAYGMATKKYSLVHDGDHGDQPARLITRLADRRADRFKQADAHGVHRGVEGQVSFGPLRGATSFFVSDAEHTHAFVVPRELVAKAQELLGRYPADRASDVLATVSAQHAFYARSTGELQSFGPDPRSPAGLLLSEKGALGDTGEVFAHGPKVTRVEGVTWRQTADFLADALAYTKQVEGKPEIHVNWERVTGANKGKAFSGKFSAERADGSFSNTAAERAQVEAHIDLVLGKSVDMAWANIFHAGEFEKGSPGARDAIRLSVHSLDPMSAAYHESLHAFMSKLGDANLHGVNEVLMKASEAGPVRRQLEALLAKEPDALKQLSDPEERAAYMYQFWAQGKLRVGDQAKTVLGKIADYVRSVLGIWSNDQRALHVMDYFHSGEFAKNMADRNAVSRALMDEGRSAVLDKARALTEPLIRLASEVGVAGHQQLRDTGIPALTRLADLMKAQTMGEKNDHGFLPSARVERVRVMNGLGDALKGYDKAQLNEALESLQNGVAPTSLQGRVAARTVRKVLDDSFEYMRKAGVQIKDLGVGKDYFPRVYDTDYISRHQKDFVILLEKHGVVNAEGTMRKIVNADGSEFLVEVNRPGMQFAKTRELAAIPNAELARFMKKNLFEIMSSYVTQATRRAEWARRFQDDGAGVTKLLAQANTEGATKAQIADAEKYVRAVDGTLGDHLNPTARRLMGNMIVYQNVRLLPLAIFSSVVDPVGIMVRGGTVGDAWSTLKRGVKEIRKNFKNDGTKDAATELAETLGVIDNAALVHTLGALYSQGMVGNTARRVNDTFFKYNLMEQFNTSMRVGATEAALKFLARHASGDASTHSARWLAELGLTTEDVKVDPSGRVKLTEADGLSADHAGKMRLAVNKWVDGAVLRPDAADKPPWMSDPHWMLVSHLKQFVYSFHETILKRVAHEYKHGNFAPAMAMASYVPIMIAADLAKGLIQGGGSTPSWKEDWGPEDYIWSGVQRGGLLGTGQFVADVAADVHRGGVGVGALAGPSIEQLGDAVRVLGGRAQFGSVALKSMPANALYAGFMGGGAEDPKFAD